MVEVESNKVVIVMPAFNAEKTLEQTYREIPWEIVHDVVLVDDQSSDKTIPLARELGIKHIVAHEANLGYGGNQKTCYRYALDLGADVVVMLHPDYQYTPKLIPTLVSMISSGLYPVVLGSRILGGGALRGGMPRYKYVANRVLTLFQNLLLGEKLSEYHTGFRAYSSVVLRSIEFENNSNNFIFDNQVISQIFMAGFEVAEVTCPTKYFPDASSISLRRSLRYGVGVITVSCMHWLHKRRIMSFKMYGRSNGN
ncbi:MAG: glycosyl transferase family 2 [Rhodospirillaceae bacterium]|nr:glycosyl transferase family 2 [Rhodospirillaceae bacterium]|tara:strand:+ start:3754 stop:4515 length:762 start_codon:yes stop_codon:yes gene_type:complete